MSKLFGEKDPFADPFFSSPFESIFGGNYPFDDPFFTQPFNNQAGSGKQITIEELNSDDGDVAHNISMPSKELVVKNQKDSAKGRQSFSFQRVAYGGLNGMYYTSSIAKRTGGDGLVLVEMKEEDKAVGESLHTISRGIHHKGHSVTTKDSSDGRVDSMQTLHNLNEDELGGFEETWKEQADRHLPGWNNGLNLLENAGVAGSSGWDGLATWGGWALPWTDSEARDLSSGEGAKKVVPVNIE